MWWQIAESWQWLVPVWTVPSAAQDHTSHVPVNSILSAMTWQLSLQAFSLFLCASPLSGLCGSSLCGTWNTSARGWKAPETLRVSLAAASPCVHWVHKSAFYSIFFYFFILLGSFQQDYYSSLFYRVWQTCQWFVFDILAYRPLEHKTDWADVSDIVWDYPDCVCAVRGSSWNFGVEQNIFLFKFSVKMFKKIPLSQHKLCATKWCFETTISWEKRIGKREHVIAY